MTDIAAKTILITGAASGIGRQLAIQLADRGGDMILWDINRQGLDRVCAEVRAARSGSARGYICDVSDRAQVYDTAAKVLADVGHLDILINNAGIVSGKRILDLPDEKIEKTFAVNTMALFWTAKAFLPAMVERNSGHIVTLASSAGLVGVARLTDYSSSKWAAVGFDESLRFELKQIAPRVITTVVCPFFIDTGMFSGAKTRFSWLLPILKEADVAKRIVRAVETDARQLMLPPLVHIVPVARALPVWLFDMVADVLGINESMETFIGRQASVAKDHGHKGSAHVGHGIATS